MPIRLSGRGMAKGSNLIAMGRKDSPTITARFGGGSRSKTRPQEVQRIIDLHHNTKIDTIAQALHQLGKRLDVVVS